MKVKERQEILKNAKIRYAAGTIRRTLLYRLKGQQEGMAKKQSVSNRARKKATRILIVEDDEITRALFQLLIERESDLSIAGVATRVEDALNMLESKPADAVILDLSFTAHMNGLAVGPKMRMLYPTLAILVVTQFEGLEDQCRSWSDGYLMKQDSPDRLVAEVRRALKVRASTPPTERNETSPDLIALLKPSQKEILRLTAEGLTANEIAREMKIKKAAVDNQTKDIYNKLQWEPGRRSKVELTKFAIQAGLTKQG